MSVEQVIEARKDVSQTMSWRSYYMLCKPKVVALIIFTALVGMLLAGVGPSDSRLLIAAITGIGLSAASGAAINHWVDRRIDQFMARTSSRPLPKHEISTARALTFALSMGAIGLAILAIEVNLLTTILTALSLIGYAVIYTMYLKHATPYNIVWGGAAGAAPPLLGWVSITGQVSLEAVILFAIIFIWTPPHFWALAIRRRKEYANAGVPMLPVTHGVDYTKSQVLYYSIALFVVSILPTIIGMSGLIYLGGTLFLSSGFLWHAIKLYRAPDDKPAMPAFKYSIIYLMLLFGLLLLDFYIGKLI